MTLSKNRIKYIRSLELKKKRKEENVFLAEGPKLIDELGGHFTCRLLVATPEWLQFHSNYQAQEIISVTTEELAKASLLKTPQQVLAVFDQPRYEMHADIVKQSLCLALDDVQDPGNLGTIIRLADWFGIKHIFCSHGTADIYNPKTVQATMGGIARVQVHYTNLPEFIASVKEAPIYGTFLDGTNIYEHQLTQNGLLVMGNEGKGVSQEVSQLINKRLYIPNYPAGSETSESLNVAIATAIACAEFRRQAAWS